MTWLFKRVRARRAIAVAALGVSLAAVLGIVSPSQATFRGQNGRLLFQAPAGANTQLFTIEPDGTGLEQLTHFKDSSGTDGAWSKDGSRVVFTRHWDPAGPNEHFLLYTIDADGTGAKALPKGGNAGGEPNWLPDGRRIIFLDFLSGRLQVIDANGTGLRSAGVPGVGGDSACVLPDGKRVAFLRGKQANGEVRAIFVAGLFGHGLKRVTPWGGYTDKIDCSPDGKRIVFAKPEFGQGGQSANVFTVKTDGSGLVQLTHASGGTTNYGAHSWSPDGMKISYVKNQDAGFQIWTMNADGTEQKPLTSGLEAHNSAWGSHS